MAKVTIDLNDLIELQTKAASSLSDQFDSMLKANISANEAVTSFIQGYLKAALEQSGHSKKRAAEKLGLRYPTFINWFNRYMKDLDQ